MAKIKNQREPHRALHALYMKIANERLELNIEKNTCAEYQAQWKLQRQLKR